LNPYRRFFWGFLFMFDFRINGLDLLPDIIGYWLFFSGLQAIMDENEHFRQAKEFVLPLIFISILDIYQIQGTSGLEPVSVVGLVIGLALTVLDLLVVYHLCRGIIEKAVLIGDDQLEYTAEKRWKYYFFLRVLFFVLFPLMLLMQQASLIIFIPYFIFWIVVIILIMQLMNQAGESLT